MARTTWTKHSFSAGELSPNIIQSRKDIPLHASGVSKCSNLIPLRAGSLISRPDSLPYSDCKLPLKASRIIPFSLTHGIYVLLVFGENELSIVVLGQAPQWTPRVLKTVKTPYYDWEAQELECAVFGQLVVLVHKHHPPYQLVYTGADYKFSKMEFSPSPWLGNGIKGGAKYEATLSIKRASDDAKDLFEVTSSVALFDENDKGKSIRLGCIPRGWRSETEYPENAFMVSGEKVYRSTKGGKSGKEWKLKEGSTYVQDGSIPWVTVASLDGKVSEASSRRRFPTTIVRPYYIWGTIEHVINHNTVHVRPRSKNAFLAGANVVEWNLSAWTRPSGYPSHVTFYQNRLLFSGGKDDELSVYSSCYNNFYDFSLDGEYGVIDPLNSLTMAVTDVSVSVIKWMHPLGEGVLVGCDTSLWLLTINTAQGLGVDFRRISGSGVYSCPPVSVGDCLFYVCGAGRRIKSVTGSIEQGFRFIEVTQFADHLFKHRISQLVYQEEPHSIIWVILSPFKQCSSQMLGCRFSADGDEDFAWHTHTIRGGRRCISAVSFPSVDHGETSVWLLVGKADGGAELERLGDFR